MFNLFKSFNLLKHLTNKTKMDLYKFPEQSRVIWIDLEMTGLDIDECHIIEAACIVTDGNLEIVAEGPNLIINQSEEILNSMQEWCITVHGKSGLTEACRKSTINLQAAEMLLLSFVRQHTPPGKCPLAGNSIHVDRMFLCKYMPELMKHIHYRIIDVSSIKELCKRWYPKDYKRVNYQKAGSHSLLNWVFDLETTIYSLYSYGYFIGSLLVEKLLHSKMKTNLILADLGKLVLVWCWF
uniref:Probable oligoribonuclease n=1 Tax=Strigamia maritima TaxID=126957 RepID=T1J6N0_STRMM